MYIYLLIILTCMYASVYTHRPVILLYSCLQMSKTNTDIISTVVWSNTSKIIRFLNCTNLPTVCVLMLNYFQFESNSVWKKKWSLILNSLKISVCALYWMSCNMIILLRYILLISILERRLPIILKPHCFLSATPDECFGCSHMFWFALQETDPDFNHCAVCIEAYQLNDVVRILPCKWEHCGYLSIFRQVTSLQWNRGSKLMLEWVWGPKMTWL